MRLFVGQPRQRMNNVYMNLSLGYVAATLFPSTSRSISKKGRSSPIKSRHSNTHRRWSALVVSLEPKHCSRAPSRSHSTPGPPQQPPQLPETCRGAWLVVSMRYKALWSRAAGAARNTYATVSSSGGPGNSLPTLPLQRRLPLIRLCPPEPLYLLKDACAVQARGYHGRCIFEGDII